MGGLQGLHIGPLGDGFFQCVVARDIQFLGQGAGGAIGDFQLRLGGQANRTQQSLVGLTCQGAGIHMVQTGLGFQLSCLGDFNLGAQSIALPLQGDILNQGGVLQALSRDLCALAGRVVVEVADGYFGNNGLMHAAESNAAGHGQLVGGFLQSCALAKVEQQPFQGQGRDGTA